MKRLLAVIGISFIIGTVLAQQKTESLLFTHLTPENGLPHNMVFSITQDERGFIWFGTNNGLGRYDGYDFKIYRPNLTKSNSISNKSITRLHCDKRGNLWLDIQGMGLNMMNLKTEKISWFFPNNNDSNTLSSNQVNCLFDDDDSTTWIGTNKGIDYYDHRQNKIIRWIDIKDFGPYANQITADKNGNLWFITQKGIGCFSRKSKSFKTLGQITGNTFWDQGRVTSIFMENKQHLWFTTHNNGLGCFDIESGKISVMLSELTEMKQVYVNSQGVLFVYNKNTYHQITVVKDKGKPSQSIENKILFKGQKSFDMIFINEDRSGNTWFSSLEGLCRYNTHDGFTYVPKITYAPRYLTDNSISEQFVDKNDNLWLSILQRGIDRVDLRQKPFKLYYANPLDKNTSIAGNNVIMLYEDSRKNIWIGSIREGLTCYNPNTNTYRTIECDAKDTQKLIFTAPAGMVEDLQGNLWLSFYDGQLARINPQTLKIQYYTNFLPLSPQYHFNGWGLRKLITDQQGNIWIACTSLGVIEFNQKSQSFIYHSSLYEVDIQGNSIYRTVFCSSDGIIWTGTQNGGLGRYNPQNHEFIHYKHQAQNPTSISNNTVYDIYEECDSILWIATAGGLNRFNRQTEVFTSYAKNINESACAVYSVLPDNQNNFWLSSDCGLLKFNRSTNSFTHYDKDDGLPGNEFNTTASLKLRSGEMFFGLPTGMVSFKPEEIGISPFHSHPTLTGLKIFNRYVSPGDSILGQPILQQQLWATEKLTLSYKINDFTLEFSALNFSAPQKIQYQYRMLGFHNEWITADASRRWANYTGLPAGEYTFEMRATNQDGLMCSDKDVSRLQILITPPFWQTWWFKLLIVIAVILITLAIIKIRLHNLQKQKQKLEKMVHDRTIELAESNALLEERQEEIYLQNEELSMHRDNLEKLVKERTTVMHKALKLAEESDRLKTAFLANLSHEIRTPMNAIIGFSNLLNTADSAEERSEFARVINSNCESLLVLINDIMDISMIEVNQIRINKSTIDIILILNELYTQFSSIVKPSVQLIIESPFLHLQISTDGIRVKQVLSNLLVNAIKFTEQGFVKFGIEKQANTLLFYVADTGIGIDSKDYNKIFDHFHKIEQPDSKIYGGTGIGLSICKNLVNLLGGKIWVESTYGKGSTFYFTIPLE